MSQDFLFLETDRLSLENDITAIAAEIKKVQGDTAESTEQTSETWHDNFMFEDGQRQMNILALRLGTMSEILARAVVVEPRTDGLAGVGNAVMVRDLDSLEERSYHIGSYIVGKQTANTVSYTSPLGKLLYLRKAGDVCEGVIGPSNRRFLILSVS